MPSEAQMQTYIDALGITRLVVGTTGFDDEFTQLLYQTLTVGRDNIVTHNGDVITHEGNIVHT